MESQQHSQTSQAPPWAELANQVGAYHALHTSHHPLTPVGWAWRTLGLWVRAGTLISLWGSSRPGSSSFNSLALAPFGDKR